MIQLIDIRTLFAVWFIVCTVLSVDLSLFWLHNQKEKGTGWWALAMLATAIGASLIVFRDYLSPLFTIELANILILLGWSLICKGLRKFFQKEKGAAWEAVPVLALIGPFHYYTYVQPDVTNRILIMSILLCIAAFRCFYLLLRRSESGLELSSTSAGYSSLIIAIFFLLRTILTLFGIGTPQTQSFLSPNLVSTITMLTLIGGYVSLILGLISLPGRRSRNNLHETTVKLEESNLKLQQSEARFQSFYDVSFEGIVFTENGIIIDANNRFAEMVGLRITELQGLPAVNVVAPEQREMVAEHISKQFEGPYKTILLAKDGHKVHAEVHGNFYTLQGRNVRVSAIRDLTEKMQAEAEIKQLQGILPICSVCKKIRDDKGSWKKIEEYIESHSEAQFSHGMCSSCEQELYGNQDWYQKKNLAKKN